MLGESKTDRWPYATTALIGVNLLVFAFELSLGPHLAPFLQQWGLDPARLSTEVSARNLVTIATSLFLHTGWLQLLVNLWFLWVFGDAVESAIGWRWFLMLYLACGVVGNVVFAVAGSGTATPAVGAGGAIAGVLGAGVALWPRARMRVLTMLAIFVALMLLYEAGLAIGISATVMNIVGGFGIGGGPVLFALSVLLTLGWFVVSAQRRKGGISLDAFMKVWNVPVWLVVACFCLQGLWSGMLAIVRPDFGVGVDGWACIGGLLAGAALAKFIPRQVIVPSEPLVPAYYLVPPDQGGHGDAAG